MTPSFPCIPIAAYDAGHEDVTTASGAADRRTVEDVVRLPPIGPGHFVVRPQVVENSVHGDSSPTRFSGNGPSRKALCVKLPDLFHLIGFEHS